jgi:nucleoside-diphosphate-sugar epimerase
MRIFVTGASGWIASAVIPELQDAGHQVVGLARSDAAAAKVEALGAEVRRGELDDLDGLRAAAAESEGVVHLGYIHDFSRMPAAAQTDRAAITAMGQALPSGAPLVIASGTLGIATGRLGTEDDTPDPSAHPRVANAQVALDLPGIRPIIARFAPTVHGEGDHGFVAELTRVARERGVSGYVGDGANRWPAVHRLDAGKLVALAVDDAPAGTILHVTAEDGVPARAIAEAIGRSLDVPTRSIAPDDAAEHFGWIGMFFAADAPVTSAKTRALLGWEPTHPTLIEDLDAGHYARALADAAA